MVFPQARPHVSRWVVRKRVSGGVSRSTDIIDSPFPGGDIGIRLTGIEYAGVAPPVPIPPIEIITQTNVDREVRPHPEVVLEVEPPVMSGRVRGGLVKLERIEMCGRTLVYCSQHQLRHTVPTLTGKSIIGEATSKT